MQQYAFEKFKEAKNFDDLFSAFADEILMIEDQYRRNGYRRIRKSFAVDDQETLAKHQTAKPIELQLDSAIKQLRVFVVTPQNEEMIDKIYSQRKRGKIVPDTALNRLDTKLTNAKKILRWFKNENRLVFSRRYIFEDKYLYINPARPIKFTESKTPFYILSELYKRPHTRHSLIARHSRKYGLSKDDSEEQLEAARIYINNRVRDATKESPELIKSDGSMFWLNTSLFHILDRIK